jgi:alpha-methylacyl-CoA racemase
MEHSDVCYAPVLTMSEAVAHPHNVARGTFVEVGGAMQPAPAPRYSSTANATPQPAPMPGDQSDEVLRAIGLDDNSIAALRGNGTVA